MRETAALVLAAGKGTRMASERPKVLHEAGGRSLLAAVLAVCAQAGLAPADTAVVAGFGAEAVEAEAAAAGARTVRQSPQLGTGHAVQSAAGWWRPYRRVVVLHGDMPLVSASTVAALIALQAERASACVLATATPAEPRAYGRILRDPAHADCVCAIVEERQATPEQRRIGELNAGFYCFDTARLDAALTHLGTDNPHGEYYLTDTVAWLAAHGGTVRAFPLADAGECLGVNDRVELAQLDLLLRRRKAEALMRAGATLQLPETVVVDPAVEVGRDTVIEAGVQLLGATRIGAHCRIRSYSILEDCVVADGAVVGPFARLRPGAALAPGVHVGNFVEVKNSRLGAGSKANHLAYLGDAEIGAGVNIGAGTITCNYDGAAKHPTRVGDGAFIGSNSTLVAPLEVGAGAYVAAGSTLTDPVPADALALGRARQIVKPGWAGKRRAAKKRIP